LNVPLVLGRLVSPAAATTVDSVSPMHMLATVAALVCGLWILIECGLLKGTEGRNDYGEDPV